MRLSTQQFFLQGSNSISSLNSQVATVQEQISSGRRVQNPSDDPAAAARILRLESQLNITQQFQRNIDFADNNLSLTETTVSSIEDSINQVLEAVIFAENGTLSSSERQSIAIEVEGILDGLESLVNTQNAQGEYIFAGFNTNQAAYAESSDGVYEYQGDNGVRRLNISDSTLVAVFETGVDLFEAIPLANGQVEIEAVAGNSGAFGVVSSQVVDRETFDAAFPEDYVVSFNPETNVAPAAANYSVTRVSDGAAIVTDAVYDASLGINFDGLQLTAVGAPQAGDTFRVDAVAEQNTLSIVAGIAEGIANIDDNEQFSEFIAGALDDIGSIQERLLASRARVGVNLGQLDSTRETLLDRELSQQALLSEIRDLDFAEAISNLTFLSFTLEATQASFTRVANLSLFNFIR